MERFINVANGEVLMINLREISRAFDVSNISEAYPGPVEITDLKEELGTKGHVLVIRGDRAYANRLGDNAPVANPKFWLYENLLNSEKAQQELATHPDHKLFDGVGFSSLEAIGYHANRIRRGAVVVMAHEMVPEKEFFDRFKNVEVIHADRERDGPLEEGYVNKQREVLHNRDDLIPLHQALHGAKALAPIGNKVVKTLEELAIFPDETFWCIASGSSLYGIGSIVKDKFGSQTMVVEPTTNPTIPDSLDLSDPKAVKEFARKEFRNYTLPNWDKKHSGIAPLHGAHVNRYMLMDWSQTGRTGIDGTIKVTPSKVTEIQEGLRDINPDYDWTETTALALAPAIQSAQKGKNVLVMAYGRDRETQYRDVIINGFDNTN